MTYSEKISPMNNFSLNVNLTKIPLVNNHTLAIGSKIPAALHSINP